MSFKSFFDNHIELLKANDVNELVEHDYHDDAVMLLLAQDEPMVVSGKAELKKVLGAYLEFVYRGFISTEKYIETDDSLFFEATIKTNAGRSRVYDALHMKDGKILRHYSGVRSQTRDSLRSVKIEKNGVTLHCMSSGEDGELVNSVIVETTGSLVVIDVLNLLPYSKELRSYCDNLGKPIDRVLITHAHPDHWFGIECFQDVPVFAFPETRADINAKGDFFLEHHRSLHGSEAASVVPAVKIVPAEELKEGTITIDGLELVLTKINDAEYNVMLAVEIPELKALIAQDLIYNGVYMFIGERTSTGAYCFDSWINALLSYKQRGFETVIPGHGEPGGPQLLDNAIEYLEHAKKGVEKCQDGNSLSGHIKARFPEYQVPLMLAMSNYFIYDLPKQS